MNPEVIFEAKQDQSFLQLIAQLPEGERLRSCIQCGSCGGTCPVSRAMRETPRRLFAMIRAGMRKEVLESATPWICASCYSCTVKCPAGIKITEIMYALKRMALKEKVTPRDTDAYRFAQAFTNVVRAHGRASELEALMRYMLFHHPTRMLAQSMVGLKMMSRGRMPILPHTIEGMDGFNKLVARAVELEEAAQ